jgi:hypothetical protein
LNGSAGQNPKNLSRCLVTLLDDRVEGRDGMGKGQLLSTCIGVMCLVATAGVRAAPETAGVQIEAAFSNDSNVTRARNGDARLSDRVYGLDARKRFERNPSEHTDIVVTIQAGAERFENNDGLSNAYVGAQIDALYRASGALSAPTFRAFLRATEVNYRSQLRDGSRISSGVSVQKYFDDRFNITAELAYNARNGRDAAFDLRDTSLRGIFEYRSSPRVAVYAIGEYRDGDVVASAPPSLAYVDIAKAIALDDAFTDATRFVYRFAARSYAATLGLNWAFGPSHSLDFSARAVKSVAKEDLDASFQIQRSNYLDNQISFAYLFRF